MRRRERRREEELMYTHLAVSLHGADRLYTYLNHIEDVGVGDYVVVRLNSGRYIMGQVVEVNLSNEAREKATKWIVDKVTFDTDKHDALTALKPPPDTQKKKRQPSKNAIAMLTRWQAQKKGLA
jgi:hypothetical protein